MGTRDKLDRLEDRTPPEPCPECGGKVLIYEKHPGGRIVYPPGEKPCSTCDNTQPDGGISFIEINCEGNERRDPDADDDE